MKRSDLETMFGAVDRCDWDTVARYFHPDMKYDRPGFPILDGKDEVVRFYRDVRSIRGQHLFEGFAIEPDTGACWGRFVGHRKDGAPLDLQFADTYLFKDGLLWRRKSYFYVPLA